MGSERRGRAVHGRLEVNGSGEEPTDRPRQKKLKSFEIPKRLVFEAWEKVRANSGAPGVDAVSIDDFAADEVNNLYKLWNRMSSGSYFPGPVRAVEIPKDHGAGVRVLGVPNVADRVAQTAAAMLLSRRANTGLAVARSVVGTDGCFSMSGPTAYRYRSLLYIERWRPQARNHRAATPVPSAGGLRNTSVVGTTRLPRVLEAGLGRRVGRHPTTVAREINAGGGRERYGPAAAQRRAEVARRRARRRRLEAPGPLRDRICAELRRGRSPAAIRADLAARAWRRRRASTRLPGALHGRPGRETR